MFPKLLRGSKYLFFSSVAKAPKTDPYQHLVSQVQAKERYRLGYPGSGYDPNFFIGRGRWKELNDSKNQQEVYLNNAGDPRTSPTTYKLHSKPIEIDVIKRCAKFLGMPPDKSAGYITSGGSEGNQAALWWSREVLCNVGPQKLEPVFYFSSACHHSIPKAARMFRLDHQVIAADKMGKIDLDDLAKALKSHMSHMPSRPVMVATTLGTTELGAIDNVVDTKGILEDEVKKNGGLYTLHADGALYGLLLPFLKPFGKINSVFDFVNTLTFSFHKFPGIKGMSGLILTTDEFLKNAFLHTNVKVGYIGDVDDITVSCSRSGNNVIQVHKFLVAHNIPDNPTILGTLVHGCKANADFLYCQLCAILGEENVIMNQGQFCVAFRAPGDQAQKKLLIEKYSLMPSGEGEWLSCHLFLNVYEQRLPEFLNDIRAISSGKKSNATIAYKLAGYKSLIVEFVKSLSTDNPGVYDGYHSIHYEKLQAEEKDLEQASDLLAKTFCSGEPMCRHLNITEADTKKLMSAVCRFSLKDNLSIVAKNSKGEIVGVILSYDFHSEHLLSLDGVNMEAFGPIFELLKQLDAKLPAELGKQKINHQFVAGVDNNHASLDIGLMLIELNNYAALGKGYDVSLHEATGPISQHVTREMGSQTIAAISYEEFEYQGERVFSGINATFLAGRNAVFVSNSNTCLECSLANFNLANLRCASLVTANNPSPDEEKKGIGINI